MTDSVMSQADTIMKQYGMLSEEGKPQPQASAPELNDISDAQRQALIENATGSQKEEQVVTEDEEFHRLKAANPRNQGESGMDYVVRLNKLRQTPGVPPEGTKPAPNLQKMNRDELDRDPKLKKKVDRMTAKVKPATTAQAKAAQRPEDVNEDTAVGSIGMSFAGKQSTEDEEMNAGRETTYAKPKKAKDKKEKKLNRESFERLVTSVFEGIK